MLDVLVEVDIGQGRCGVPAGAGSRTAGADDCRTPVPQFRRIAGLSGQDPDDGRSSGTPPTETGLDKLAATISEVENAGLPVDIRAGGGTGTAPFDLDRGLLTEIQTGSYVFMDSRYSDIGRPGANAPPFENALFIMTAVVSKLTRPSYH